MQGAAQGEKNQQLPHPLNTKWPSLLWVAWVPQGSISWPVFAAALPPTFCSFIVAEWPCLCPTLKAVLLLGYVSQEGEKEKKRRKHCCTKVHGQLFCLIISVHIVSAKRHTHFLSSYFKSPTLRRQKKQGGREQFEEEMLQTEVWWSALAQNWISQEMQEKNSEREGESEGKKWDRVGGYLSNIWNKVWGCGFVPAGAGGGTVDIDDPHSLGWWMEGGNAARWPYVATGGAALRGDAVLTGWNQIERPMWEHQSGDVSIQNDFGPIPGWLRCLTLLV